MNEAHFHLVVNHLPLITPIIALIVLVAGYILKSAVLKRMAMFLFLLCAAFAGIAAASGEGAEEVVEGISGVSHAFIEHHEDAAGIFAILCYILGALALLSLLAAWKKHSLERVLIPLVGLFAVVTLYFGKAAATTGGEIRHTEIRDGQVPVGGEHDDD